MALTEKQAAEARLDQWSSGYLAGYRQEKRQANQGATYLSGYRAGKKNRLAEEADIPTPTKKARR